MAAPAAVQREHHACTSGQASDPQPGTGPTAHGSAYPLPLPYPTPVRPVVGLLGGLGSGGWASRQQQSQPSAPSSPIAGRQPLPATLATPSHAKGHSGPLRRSQGQYQPQHRDQHTNPSPSPTRLNPQHPLGALEGAWETRRGYPVGQWLPWVLRGVAVPYRRAGRCHGPYQWREGSRWPGGGGPSLPKAYSGARAHLWRGGPRWEGLWGRRRR